jgi:hypothetical protein
MLESLENGASVAFHRMEAVRMDVSSPFLAGNSSKVEELLKPGRVECCGSDRCSY